MCRYARVTDHSPDRSRTRTVLRVAVLNTHTAGGAIPGCGNLRHRSRGSDVSTKEKEKPKTVQEGNETAVDHRNTRIQGLMGWVPAPPWHQKTTLLKEPSVQRCRLSGTQLEVCLESLGNLKKKNSQNKTQCSPQAPPTL